MINYLFVVFFVISIVFSIVLLESRLEKVMTNLIRKWFRFFPCNVLKLKHYRIGHLKTKSHHTFCLLSAQYLPYQDWCMARQNVSILECQILFINFI